MITIDQTMAYNDKLKSSKPHMLVLTNAFPTKDDPNKGLDIQEQIRRFGTKYEVKVIHFRPKNILTNKEMPFLYRWRNNDVEAIESYYYSFPKIGVIFSGFFYFIACRDLIIDLHKTFSLNLIVCYWTYPEGFGASLIAKKLNIPLVIRPRGSDINIYIQNKLLRNLIKYVLKKADEIIPVCNQLGTAIENLGIPSDKIKCIPFGVDTNKFKPLDKNFCRKKLSINLNCKVILFVGNLVDVKGIDYLLDAMKILENEGVENLVLNILGTGPLETKYRDKIKKFKSCKIFLQGGIPNHEVLFWMNASDLFCLPSLSEGYPNVLMEALACGLPVVASRVGGIPEIIDSPDLGVLVAPMKPDKIAQAIKSVLGRKWDSKTLIEKAINNNWDKATEKILKEYETLTSIHNE
jgi:teichuronic acid biosynthesis glycosyltransferase TuaC